MCCRCNSICNIKNRITEIIDEDKDSLDFINWEIIIRIKVEHIGVKESIDLEGPLIF